MGMFTSNVDITACIVGAVAEFPSSYISTSVFFLLSPSCDRNLHYIWMAVLVFFCESDWAHRDDPEQPEPKVCQEVCSRLLLWDGAEDEVFCVWYWQWHTWPEWWRFSRGAWMYPGPGELQFVQFWKWTVRSSPYSLLCDNVIVCVQIVSNRQMTRPLMLRNHRPAGHGTITVSGLIFSFISSALAVGWSTLCVDIEAVQTWVSWVMDSSKYRCAARSMDDTLSVFHGVDCNASFLFGVPSAYKWSHQLAELYLPANIMGFWNTLFQLIVSFTYTMGKWDLNPSGQLSLMPGVNWLVIGSLRTDVDTRTKQPHSDTWDRIAARGDYEA